MPVSNASGVRQSSLSFMGERVDGAVGRDEEPDGLSVGEKELGLGRFVFPTHATRAAEVHRARFDLDAGAAVAVRLQEDGLERLHVVVRDSRAARTTGVACGEALRIQCRKGSGQLHKAARHRYDAVACTQFNRNDGYDANGGRERRVVRGLDWRVGGRRRTSGAEVDDCGLIGEEIAFAGRAEGGWFSSQCIRYDVVGWVPRDHRISVSYSRS